MKLLFMCVANSARSQIAEGLAKHLFPEYEVQSAGSAPSIVNPYAIAVMKEKGIDISKHASKSIDQLPKAFVSDVDVVITLCAEEVCPILPNSRAKKLHWPFLDPATREKVSEEELLIRFRKTRDQIEERLLTFKNEVLR